VQASLPAAARATVASALPAFVAHVAVRIVTVVVIAANGIFAAIVVFVVVVVIVVVGVTVTVTVAPAP